MQRLIQDIRTQTFSKIYLLCGEEDYLRQQYKDNIVNALLPERDSMNRSDYSGNKIPIKEVIDLAQTLPFLSERRVILIHESGFFKDSVSDEFVDYMNQIPDSTYFVFSEKQVDKRSKLFKAVKKNGYVCEFEKQSQETLTKWVLGIIKREGKQITNQGLDAFFDRVGNSMTMIQTELSKLLAYTLERNIIEIQDVEAICVEQIQNRIFDMINHVAKRQQKEALKLYYDLLALKEPPMKILSLLTRQFHMLYQVKRLRERGFDAKIIAKNIGVADFIVSKYIMQAQMFKANELRTAFEECVQAEEDIKTGKIPDLIAVELLLFERSQLINV